MKKLSLVVQIIHLVFAIISPLIPILTSKYDFYYIVLVFLTVLHWNIFKGECVLSYFEKKFVDPTYQLGQTRDDLFRNILGVKTTNIFIQLNFIGIFIVLYRNYGLKNFRSMGVLVFSSIILFYSSSKIKSKLNKVKN